MKFNMWRGGGADLHSIDRFGLLAVEADQLNVRVSCIKSGEIISVDILDCGIEAADSMGGGAYIPDGDPVIPDDFCALFIRTISG